MNNGHSQRKVLTELEILTVTCPTCNCVPGVGCLNPERHVLAKHANQTELSFHPKRVAAAFEDQFRKAMGKMGATEKALVCYYSFISLCDSCSTKSMKLFGKEMSSRDIQTFFAQQAIQELKHDGLL